MGHIQPSLQRGKTTNSMSMHYGYLTSIRLHLVPLSLTALPIKEKHKLTHLWHNHFLIMREHHFTSFPDYGENKTKF